MPAPIALLDEIKNLEPLPHTAQRLTEAAFEENLSLSEIADIVEYDQAVVSNLLRIANSPLYRGLVPIEDIRQAVSRLGTNALLEIVLGDYLKRIKCDVPLYSLGEVDLWLHGAAASLAIGEIAKESRTQAVPPTASIAGLVHDVGKLLIARFLKDDAPSIRELAEQKKIPAVEAEKAVLGYVHTEVGGAIARDWGFPEEIVQAIEEHHTIPAPNPTPTLDAVQLANLVTKTLGVGLGAEGSGFLTDPAVLERFGIDLTGYCRICARTASKLEALRKAFCV